MAEWSTDLDLLAERIGQRFEDVVRTVTLLLFTRVIMRSPVDTGRFRGNWIVSYNAISTDTKDTTDETGRATEAAAKAAILASPVGGIVYMCNSLPYALVLEYGQYPNPPEFRSQKRGEDGVAVHVIGGYSMQAPHGMVRISVREFQQAIDEAIRRTQ